MIKAVDTLKYSTRDCRVMVTRSIFNRKVIRVYARKSFLLFSWWSIVRFVVDDKIPIHQFNNFDQALKFAQEFYQQTYVINTNRDTMAVHKYIVGRAP